MNPRRPKDAEGTAPPALTGCPDLAWRIHGERVLLLGWGRAILLQLAHPLVAAGVADHSDFHSAAGGRLRRLQRTLTAMLHLTFGPPADAEQAARRINAIHDRVHGRLPEPAGMFPAGTPYSAHDPVLLRWVHATLVDSHLLAYQGFVGPLTPAERDAYCVQSTRRAGLLGIPDGFLPATLTDLRTYLEGMLSSGAIVVTPDARRLARAIVDPPAPGVARPLLRLMRVATIGQLPPTIREAYGFPWDARDEERLRRAARTIRALLPYLPAPLRYWRTARVAQRRALKELRAGRRPGRRRVGAPPTRADADGAASPLLPPNAPAPSQGGPPAMP